MTYRVYFYSPWDIQKVRLVVIAMNMEGMAVEQRCSRFGAKSDSVSVKPMRSSAQYVL